MPKRSVTLAVSRAVRWNNTPTFPLLLYFKKKKDETQKSKEKEEEEEEEEERWRGLILVGFCVCWGLDIISGARQHVDAGLGCARGPGARYDDMAPLGCWESQPAGLLLLLLLLLSLFL